MSELIAVDLALLPDREMADYAVGLSQRLGSTSLYNLTPTDRIPHITLFHAHIQKNDVDRLKEIAHQASEKLTAFPLIADLDVRPRLDPEPGKSTEFLYQLLITCTEPLDRFASLVADAARPLAKIAGRADNIEYVLDAGEVKHSLQYHPWFLQNFSLETFLPHITLGLASEPGLLSDDGSKQFLANRLALCQLGMHGTCRKILAEWPLTGKAS